MPLLHPDARRLLDLVRLAQAPPIQAQTPAQARLATRKACAALQHSPEPVAEARPLDIPGPGSPIPARLYRGLPAPAGPVPALLYLHGGGWVTGDLDTHDALCRRLANLGRCAVLAVAYRTAPEHPFPAAVDDSAAALRWLAANAAALGLDPSRLGLAGDSAGGTLAAVLALMGRDGSAPATACQILFYPATDLTGRSSAARTLAPGLAFTAETLGWFIGHYTPDPASRTDWRASPLLAPSLAGAPPAFVLTVGQDPLAAQGQAYAARLEADGVAVTAVHLSGFVHGIMTMNRLVPAADAMMAMAAAFAADCWRTRPG